jgi:hypothetical protein
VSVMNTSYGDIDEIAAEIERLRRKAETGEQWAEICALEADLIAAKAEYAEDNGQFGVGA